MHAATGRSRGPMPGLILALGVLLCATASAQAPADATVQDIRFSQFFAQPVGPRGLDPSAALLQANGRPVRLTGYMVSQEDPPPGRFLLAPRPVQMSEQADGDADDLPPATVTVLLDAAQRARVVVHRRGLVTLTGVLSVGRQEDADGRVSWVRLQLAADALSAQALAPQPGDAGRPP